MSLRILILLLISCGETATDPLSPPPTNIPPPSPPPSPPPNADAGAERDAGVRPPADIVPGIMEFRVTQVGSYFERTIQAVNRNNVATVVLVLSDPDAFDVFPAETYVPSNTRREIVVRFVPTEVGVHQELLEIDACAQGCITSVRLVGTAE